MLSSAATPRASTASVSLAPIPRVAGARAWALGRVTVPASRLGWGLMLTGAVIGAAMSANPGVSWRAVLAVAAAGTVFAGVRRLAQARLDQLAWGILAAGHVVSVVANVQIDRNAWKLNAVNRVVYGWFGHLPRLSDVAFNQNAVAAFLILAIPFGLAARPRCLGLAAAALLTGELLLMESRAAVLSLGLACGLLAVRSRGRWRWLWTLAPAGGLALLLSGRLGLPFAISALPTGGSSAERLAIWQSALMMLADTPLTGIGPGMFQRTYPLYMLPAYHTTQPHAHNLPLQTYLDTGPLGLIGLGVLIASAVAGAVRLRAHGSALAWAAAISSAAVLLHAQVDSYFAGDPRTYWMMFVPLAIVAADWHIDLRWLLGLPLVAAVALPKVGWTNLGSLDRLRGDAAGARWAFSHAPESWIAQRGLALLDLEAGDQTAAVAHLRAAVQDGAPGVLPRYELAEAAYGGSTPESALAMGHGANQARPQPSTVLPGSGSERVEAAAASGSTDNAARLELARTLLTDARWSSARAVLKPVHTAEAEALMALIDQQSGDTPAAMQDLQSALDENPEDPALHRLVAQTLSDAGHEDLAAPWRDSAAELEREGHPSSDVAGRVYEAAGRYDLARQEFAHVAAGDPIGSYDLGQLQVLEGQPAAALQLLSQAVQAIPNQETFRLGYARALMLAGEPRLALQQYRAVLALDPGNIEAQQALGKKN